MLQERLELTPVVQPPDGPASSCDVRILCFGDRAVDLFWRLAPERMTSTNTNRSIYCNDRGPRLAVR